MVFSIATICLVAPVQTPAQSADSPRFTRTVLAIKAAEPAVVNIEGNKPSASGGNSSGEPHQVNGMGSGVIIDENGYILTNQHVVQDVSRIEVTLHDNTKYIGRIIDHDPSSDLALIKISPRSPLKEIAFGTSSDLMHGEPVIAIGNPFGYHHTVTEGIISSLHRNIPVNGAQEYRDLIQTDASINPGNSGGPLLNAEGKMIGINAAVRVGAQGIGFAIPVDNAMEIAADLLANVRRNRLDDIVEVRTEHNASTSSLKVAAVTAASKVLSGELAVGDVITSIGGQNVTNRLEYELALANSTATDSVELHYLRSGVVGQVALDLKPLAKLVSMASNKTSKPEANEVEERVWRQLGLRLQTTDPQRVLEVEGNYKGGLKVWQVRDNSPAANALIRNGDILVGLINWQTPDWEDLEWIMNSNEMKTQSKARFYIVRAGGLYEGVLEMPKVQRNKTASAQRTRPQN